MTIATALLKGGTEKIVGDLGKESRNFGKSEMSCET